MTSWCGKRSLYSFTCGESHQLCEFISSKHHIANWYDVLLLISFYAYTSHDVLFISILLSIFLHFHSFPLPSGIHTATENDHNTIVHPLCAPLQNIITICISCYHVNLIIFTLRQVLLLLRCCVAEVMILLLLHLFLLLSLLHSYSYWSQRLMTIRCN